MKKKAGTYLLMAVLAVTVVGCTTPTRYGRSTGEYIDDKTIASDVKGALNGDSLVAAAPIRAESFRGHVHLTGFVDHPIQKERASELTRRVAGVKWFKNDIVVKSQLPDAGVAAAGTRMREPAGAERPDRNGEMKMEMDARGESTGEWQQGLDSVHPRESRAERPGLEIEPEQDSRTPRNR